jgi:hypothetical protein
MRERIGELAIYRGSQNKGATYASHARHGSMCAAKGVVVRWILDREKWGGGALGVKGAGAQHI